MGVKKSVQKTVIYVINRMEIGTKFHGNQLHNIVASINPCAINVYTDTILREARRACRDKFVVVNRNKSLYERVQP